MNLVLHGSNTDKIVSLSISKKWKDFSFHFHEGCVSTSYFNFKDCM